MQLIESEGIDAEIIEYLKEPPDFEQLVDLLDLLGLEPRELMRTREKAYKENGLDNPDLSRNDLISAMVTNPILIERPIVIHGSRAVIGRPPDKVRDILR